VLVDGDDHNEPIADAVRGILDGHVVMQRSIAERGRFPAINVLKSVSRTMPKSADPAYLPVIMRGRQVMATYADMEELIRLGAYRAGSSPEVDEAIRLHEPLEGSCARPRTKKRAWPTATAIGANPHQFGNGTLTLSGHHPRT
jgi:flagellum-specific ATP synthase